MQKYDPKNIEPKWQQVWADTKLYQAVTGDKSRDKFYMLTEFPYPSGAGLHAGHIREYTIGDVIARHKRMQGYNVLYPMGYDAFGLPTENYAIKNKIRPQDATVENIATFRKQFDSMGFSFDWDREVNTTDPDYYRWTQWLFLKFFEAGLAYQAEMAINWCPKEKTGLANEEVVDGKHERCGTPVEKKMLKQWMLKITAYGDRLIDGLKTVDYPSRIADQQVNWIGRSDGAEITWKLRDVAGQDDDRHSVTVYTTRPDTLLGATFLVVSPEVATSWLNVGWQAGSEVRNYVEKALRESELQRQEDTKQKTGVNTGIQAVHPVTGELVPVWVADYVLGGYGTGAIMAVPAHDERDGAFAEAFGLPVREVITAPKNHKPHTTYTGYGPLINSGQFDGLDGPAAKYAITKFLEDRHVGQAAVKYKLRDWIFSRQHYWGEPIPIIHCADCGAVPVPDDQLPVTLPDVKNYEPTETGESPLAAIPEWVNTTCPKCGGHAQRETDTMPNWAGSSWYYLRYMDPNNNQAFASPAALDYWQMVDLYLGGMEHTTLHLLYSRFWHQFFYDQKLVPTPEPYAARRGQGIVLASDGRKMSKSLGNVVNPTDIIATHGADTLRLYILFMAPYDETTPWSEERLGGSSRFIYKVWNLAQELMGAHTFTREAIKPQSESAFATAVDKATHKTIKKIHDELGGMRFNTAVSSLMEYVNFLSDQKTKPGLLEPVNAALAWRTVNTLVQLISPMTPHLSEELWRQLGWEGSVHVSGWPEYDPELIQDDIVTVVVQVNGKVRANIMAAPSASEAELTDAAKADPNVAKYLDEGKLVKTVIVPRKLVNFVVK